MAETKFTPGPWYAEMPMSRWRVRTVNGNAYIMEGGGLYTHADVRREADAHLIAAAPDLYAALDGMVSACEALYKSGRLDASAWLTAREALAKARGED